jgi:RHS repeat-associated protein
VQLVARVREARAASDGSTLAADRGIAADGGAGEASTAFDLFTGAAIQVLPILAPRGTGGLTPELSLGYSSAAAPDSWVGVGWSLGPIAISRSLKGGVPTYSDDFDDFTLGGQELVPENFGPLPRTYHTRRESFVRIVREADDSWTVTDANGLRRRFGVGADARIEKSAGLVFEWLLSEQEDVSGNVVTYHYDRRDPGIAYPSEIRYTLRRQPDGSLASLGNDPSRDRTIRFVLESAERPDVSQSFLAGFERRLAHRAAAIEVRVGASLVRRYQLHYGVSPDSFRSLLERVEAFGTDDGAVAEPQTTRFWYRSNLAAGTTGWQLTSWPWPAGLSLVEADRSDGGVRIGDVDGDGRPDLIKALAITDLASSTSTLSADSGVYLNTGVGFETTPSAQWRIPQVPGSESLRTPFLAHRVEPPSTGDTWGSGRTLVDLTGDGRVDFPSGQLVLDPSSGGIAQIPAIRNSWWESSPAGLVEHFYADLPNENAHYSTAKLGFLPIAVTAGYGTLGGNTRFADLTGDGLPEAVIRGAETWSFFAGGTSFLCLGTGVSVHQVAINRGGLQFDTAPLRQSATPVEIPNPVGFGLPPSCAASFVHTADYQLCDSAADSECAEKQFFNVSHVSGSLAVGSSWEYSAHFELGNLLIDLNADRLSDSITAYTRSTRRRYSWLNTGNAAFAEQAAWNLPAAADLYSIGSGSSFSFDRGVRFADVNGDGRVDVVSARLGNPRLTWLNDGDVAQPDDAGAWQLASAWAVPEDFVDPGGKDLGVHLADLDGDGMVDLVRAVGGAKQVYLNRGEVPDLLIAIENPLGGRLAFEYTPSTAFEHVGPDGIPDFAQVRQLVTRITASDEVGPPQTTTLSYADGLFDVDAREFRGFGEVRAVREADRRLTVTRFHQDPARQGLPESVSIYDDASLATPKLWSVVRNRYRTTTQAPYVALLESVDRFEHDGSNTALRHTRTLRRFDGDIDGTGAISFGNPTAEIQFGEVDAQGAPLVPSEVRHRFLDYTPPNLAAHITNRVAREELRAGGVPGSGALLRRTRFRYDGLGDDAMPTQGRQSEVIASGGEPGEDAATRYRYDAYGNRISVTSAREVAGEIPAGSGTTTYSYDPDYQTFVTRETNGLGHSTLYAYTPDPALCPASIPHAVAEGLVHSVQGPNDTPTSRALRCFDGFGRPTRERGPDGLHESRTAYGDAALPRTRTFARRVDAAQPAPHDRVAVETLDGLGRVVEIRAGGASGRTIAVTSTFDAAGRLATRSDPTYLGEPTRVTSYAYDPLDRITRVMRPGGRVATTSYVRGTVTATDPNGNAVISKLDPFGQVVEIIEADGSATDRTRYAYTLSGELASITDRHGNVTAIRYDLLGRRRELSDPDTGVSRFDVYDRDGNLVEFRHPSNVRTTYAYDALGRVTSRSVRTGSVTDDAVSWSYDAAPLGRGRLQRRTDAFGSYEVLGYDRLGRATSERRTLDGRRFDFATTYDMLGQTSSRTFPTGRTLTHTRDARGFVNGVCDRVIAGSGACDPALSLVHLSAIDWEADGRPRARFAANGRIETRHAYETSSGGAPNTGRLDRIELRVASALVEDLDLAYDAGDRLTRITSAAFGNFDFAYDALDRLTRAAGPYGPGGATQALHYDYDRLGNLRCVDAPAAPTPTSCDTANGARALSFPTSAGPRPHAPTAIDGAPAIFSASTGNLLGLGSRSYVYDALGRLTSVLDAGAVLAELRYDGADRRVRSDDHSGSRALRRYDVSSDFEWDETRGLAHIQVRLAGQHVATLVEPFAPQSALAPALKPEAGDRIRLDGLVPAAAGISLLVLGALRVRRRSAPLRAPALAGSTAVLLYIAGADPAEAALPDGDLDGDGRLSVGDATRALRAAAGALVLAPDEALRADVAPVNGSANGSVGAADGALILRAIGEDVDGDGLDSATELAVGSSPFRSDSDGDTLLDLDELALGTHPGRADSDADGWSDGVEIARATDPLTRDTDGDGAFDPADPQPLTGVRYHHGDQLGSIVSSRASSGALIQRTLYRPFGSAVGLASGAAPTPSFGFTGQRFEAAVGLYDYGARWYEPALGRFLQPDPLIPNPRDPQELNRYAYARNNPLLRIDPSGHFSIRAGLGFGTLTFDSTLGPGDSFDFDFGPSLGFGISTGSLANNTGFRASAFVGYGDGGFYARTESGISADPQYFRSSDPGRTPISLADAAAALRAAGSGRRNIASFGVGGTSDHIGEFQQRTEAIGGGILVHNPSDDLVTDLVESAIQKLFPGVLPLDWAMADLITAAGEVEEVRGFSQGSLTVRNGVALAALQGARASVDTVTLIGTPSGWLSAVIFARGVGGARSLEQQRSVFDPVVSLGEPVTFPTAIGATAAWALGCGRCWVHDYDRYVER